MKVLYFFLFRSSRFKADTYTADDWFLVLEAMDSAR